MKIYISLSAKKPKVEFHSTVDINTPVGEPGEGTKPKKKNPFVVGQRVLVKYEEDNWWTGNIKQLKINGFKIKFENGSSEVVNPLTKKIYPILKGEEYSSQLEDDEAKKLIKQYKEHIKAQTKNKPKPTYKPPEQDNIKIPKVKEEIKYPLVSRLLDVKPGEIFEIPKNKLICLTKPKKESFTIISVLCYSIINMRYVFHKAHVDTLNAKQTKVVGKVEKTQLTEYLNHLPKFQEKEKTKEESDVKQLKFKRAQVIEVKWPSGKITNEVIETVYPNNLIRLYAIPGRPTTEIVKSMVVRIVKQSPTLINRKRWDRDKLKDIFDDRYKE